MPDLPERRILKLIGSLYDAAEKADPAAWTPVYLEIANIVSSGPGALNFFLKDKSEYSTVTGTFDPKFDREYTEYFHNVNPFKNAVAGMRSGERFNRKEQLKDSDFRNTEFYQDYYRKYDLFHFEHQVFLAERGIACGISLMRSESQGNFTPREIRLLGLLMPHLQRAFKLYLNFSDVKRENGILSDALDHVPRCVVVVGTDRKIVFANNRAQILLKRKDGIFIDKYGHIATSSPDEGRQLRKILDGVFSGEHPYKTRRGEGLKISRPSGLRPLQILVTSIAESQFRSDRKECLALLFISDPDELPVTVEEVLMEIYQLTPAEARVAAILAESDSLAEVCVLLDIKQSTARTHLKHIFAKTETNSQSELIKLILRGPASIAASRANI